MSKKSLIFQGPVATRSGYGDHARDLVYSLINSEKYDVKIISMPWGNTPMDALEDGDPKNEVIKAALHRDQSPLNPDIFVQVSVPNEFITPGKYLNIGITAGIETTQCAPEWLEGMNRMSFNIVPSEFSKKVFEETKYEVRDKNTNALQSLLESKKDIKVLFEGIDLSIFKKTDEIDESINEILNPIKEDFLFLSVGHWLSGDIGEDRKNISGLIHTFFNTFKNKDNQPGLVLKTSGASFSIKDRERILTKINAIKSMFTNEDKLPNIYLIHGNLTKTEMNSLYNHDKIKAMVSFTKGEGFGRPLLEFAATGKPILVSGFSGHMDFINPAFHTFLAGELKPIHKSAVWNGVLVEGSQWFTVNYEEASRTLTDIVKSYKKYKYQSIKFLDHINKWSLENMQEKLIDIIDSAADIPERVELKLPSLKLPQLKKIS